MSWLEAALRQFFSLSRLGFASATVCLGSVSNVLTLCHYGANFLGHAVYVSSGLIQISTCMHVCMYVCITVPSITVCTL